MQKLAFYSGPDYLELKRDPDKWVIEQLLPVGGTTNLYGKPKSRKSFMALEMAAAVANQRSDWSGFKIRKTGPVAYLQADTPRGEWAERVEKLQRRGYDTSKLFFADLYTIPYPFNILDTDHNLQLLEQVKTLDPVLVVIDTLREVFRGNENDSDIMRDVIGNLTAVSRPAAVLLLSHARKDSITSRDDDLMDGNRGSSYIPGRMDVIIKLGKKMTLEGRATGHREFKVRHHRDGWVAVKGMVEKDEWLRLARILLGKFPSLKVAQAAAYIISGTAEDENPEEEEGVRTGPWRTIRDTITPLFKHEEEDEWTDAA